MVPSLDTRWTDNVYLSGTDEMSDVVLSPQLKVYLIYVPAKSGHIRLDLGLGYNFYINHKELNFLSAGLTPNTVLDYQVVVGNVMTIFYDRLTAPNDNRTRPEVVKGAGSTALVNSQQLNNTIGMTTIWAINEELVLLGGYGYQIARNFSDLFTSQNYSSHLLNTSLEKRFGPVWSAGAYANYSITDYSEPVQNDATGWSIGPLLSYRPYKNFSLEGSVGYSVTTFEFGGSPTAIQDASNFSGLIYEVSVEHQFSPRMRHQLSIAKTAQLGLGSNFTENQTITYMIAAPEAIRKVGFSAAISWIEYSQSAPVFENIFKDSGTLFRTYLGADYLISRNVNGRLGLAHNRRSSKIVLGDYNETAAMVSLSYMF
ncbi:MAG: hypothetical protein EXS36_14430 [Pedosphaera sp.]|nr:hypothetical protein [Pedosphaera sp.]